MLVGIWAEGVILMRNTDYTLHELFCILYKTGKVVRDSLESKYPNKAKELCGCCIEASNMLITQLNSMGIQAQECDGWVIYYDNPDSCSDEPCDPHSMVKVPYQDNYIYLDVTATQFQFCISEQLPRILITKQIPYWFVESNEKPMELLLKEFPEWYED